MRIGIDGSRAFIKNRTGIEEYSYQVIKHLAYRQTGLVSELSEHEIILYVRKDQKIDFILPKNWKVKIICFYYLWTQLGLSLEMLLHPVDALFIPAHTVPCIHPVNTIVTIHGLEYELCPEAYSFLERIYMSCSIKNSCKWASSIIAVSNNTKLDLMRLYKVDSKKIQVIYESCNNNFQFPISNFQSNPNVQNSNLEIDSKFKIQNSKFLLFIGRLEERKNVINIVNAFEILKEQYKIPYKLILAGKAGFGYEKIKDRIIDSNCCKDIVELGYISEEKKWELLKNADVFIFPSFYEGFGLPILEAQSAGVPVVSSNVSAIPEVADGSALLVDPNNAEEIADAIYKLISDENFRNEIIKKGQMNIQRFSWEKCAREIENLLTK